MVPVAPGFHSHGGTPLSLEGLVHGTSTKTSINMDDDWGYPYDFDMFFSLLVLNEGNAWVAGGCRNYY